MVEPVTNGQEFFAGVDEMQVYLDRNKQDPHHRQERLRVLSRGLPHNHGSRAVAAWFTEGMKLSFGASGAAFYAPFPPGEESVCWITLGQAAEEALPDSLDDGMILPLVLPRSQGWPMPYANGESSERATREVSAAPVLVLWGIGVVDELTGELLRTLAGDAALAFERACEIESLAQDTAYDVPVLLRRQVLEQAAVEIGSVPLPGCEHLLIVVDDAKDDEDRGLEPLAKPNEPVGDLVGRIRQVLPVAATFGAMGDRWIAALGSLRPKHADAVVKRLRSCIPQATHARYRVGIDDLTGAIERLCRRRQQRQRT